MSCLEYLYDCDQRPRYAVYKCSCGRIVEKRKDHVKSGKTRSCGHLQAIRPLSSYHVKHGHATPGKRSRTYNTWLAMRRRCLDEKHRHFKDYGGRGITVCERWLNDFANFLADMGKRPPGMTLDRDDPNGNYEKSNCKWATHTQQNNNKRKNANGTVRR